MFLVRLLVLSLFLVSLVGSQPAHPAGVQSNLGTGNLSFPWSRLRLPRYPSCYFFFFFQYLRTGSSQEDCWTSVFWHIFLYPRYIIPFHYHLLLHPNLTSLSFTGSVQIQIDVQNNTNWVVLHSKGLQISKATILDQNLAHLSDQVAVNAEQSLLIWYCYRSWTKMIPISSCSRFFQFFITLPMSRLVFSLPGCSTVGKSTFCILSLGQNLQKASMASIRAHTEPAQERPGQTR